MALIRALVRRRLGRIPTHYPAFARFEMDDLATRLVYSEKLRGYRAGLAGDPSVSSQEGVETELQWKVKTAEDTRDLPFHFNKPQPEDIKKYHSASSSGEKASCRQLIRVRERLGHLCDNLCDWQSLARESALSLASSIEAFMNTLYSYESTGTTTIKPGKPIDQLDWAVETMGLASTEDGDKRKETIGPTSTEQEGKRRGSVLIPV